MKHKSSRKLLVMAYQALAESGLNQGTAGNLSLRVSESEGYLITPSALSPEQTTIDDIVMMSWQGASTDFRQPSSEWRFHQDIYLNRRDVKAIVHTHAPWCTTLACMNCEIPSLHYMVALAGGNNIRCATYARFGSQQLSDAVVVALEGRNACLMANHGMLATGSTLSAALALTHEIENLAKIYVQTLQVGEPVLINSREMQGVLKQFEQYKKQV